ncbi:MAG: VOC family protein [Desulfuromusa sp.]|jgi:catechol 2,3-dioxygenase-like lactoylglutathione lyase family enzyme|nr:VOC family protein [Desulfuromusa sp.]
MNTHRTHKRIGELVIRSENPQRLVAFYREIVGLDLFANLGTATFLKVTDDLEGHPQMLAIFDKAHEYSGPKDMNAKSANTGAGSLHHFAFALEKVDFESEQKRLEEIGVDIQIAEHRRFGWRSLYLYDPDGNSVEFVCYDPDVLNAGETQQA